MADYLIACHTAPELDQGSDHFPVVVKLAAEAQYAPEVRRYYWKKMDSNAIQAGAEHLWPLYYYTDPSPSYIEEYTNYLLAFVQQLVNDTVPWARPSNRAAPWWTQELQELVHQARRLRRRHVQSGETLDHD